MEIYRIAASADAVGSLPQFTKICGMYLVAGSDNATASIFDAATQTGTAKLTLKALANTQSPQVETEGFALRTGLSVTLTGTNPILYVMVE